MTKLEDRAKILIVDDTPDNLVILGKELSAFYDVRVARKGREALEAVATDPPDLILLDIMMPEMDGYEVCRRLKDDRSLCDIPVIFVTAMQNLHDEEKGFELGAADYITKPFSPSIVRARVRTHIRLKKQSDQLKNSITLLQHETEMLKHRADLGIQAASLAHDINNILEMSMVAQLIPRYLSDDLPEKSKIKGLVDDTMFSLNLGRTICQGYTSYLRDIDAEAKEQSILPLLQPIDMYARIFKGKLTRDISSDIPPIKCKGYQLKKVFVNLFVNACQVLEKNTEQIIAIRVWSENGQVFFSIKDNGLGIPSDILPNIFDECFTTKPQGTGLGLFIVKQIIDAHDGTIEVTTNEGEGTTFTLAFPAHETESNLSNT